MFVIVPSLMYSQHACYTDSYSPSVLTASQQTLDGNVSIQGLSRNVRVLDVDET